MTSEESCNERFDKIIEYWTINSFEKSECHRCGKKRPLTHQSVFSMNHDTYFVCNGCYEEIKQVIKEWDRKHAERVWKFKCVKCGYKTDRELEYEHHITRYHLLEVIKK